MGRGFESLRPRKLKILTMFRKRDEDEKRELPDIWKFIILVGFIVGMFVGIMKFTDWVEERDMMMQYGYEYTGE